MNRRLALRALLVLFVALGAIAIWRAGIPTSAEALRARVLALGPWAPLGYVAMFTVVQALGLSSWIFFAAAVLVWPPPQAALLTWAGTMGAAAVGFSFARTVGREYAQRKLGQRLARYDERLARHGLRTVAGLRAIFFNAPWLHLLLGISRVRARDYYLGTLVGNVPQLVVATALALWAR